MVTPIISITGVTDFEGSDAREFNFIVKLSEVSTQDVSVQYATQNGTAVDGVDFIADAGTLTIEAGETQRILSITINGDDIREVEKSFSVILSNPVSATIDSGEAIGIIKNDDDRIEKNADGYATPDQYTGYENLWSDEFSGSEINAGSWTHELGGHGWGNNELQTYTADQINSYIQDGNLVIQALSDSQGKAYTSARMITKDKVEFTHGRIDVRAKLPTGQGIWPAIWMLGANIDEVSWPACGEIDIMELVGHEPDEVHGTAHWGVRGSPSTFNGSSLVDENGFQDTYHVWTLMWEENSIKWYVDEQLLHSISSSQVTGTNYPFNSDFFILFNIAVGGNWPGSPDATTAFPQTMEIDYIRVFQPKG